MRTLEYLVHLCHLKNELNRKRRRFYSIARDMDSREARGYVKKNYIVTREEAIAGYKQAKTDMKAMTAEMRSLRIELGVSLVWTDHGAIGAVKTETGWIYYRSFKKTSEAYVAEMYLLGEKDV